jgi:hypothetical protein
MYVQDVLRSTQIYSINLHRIFSIPHQDKTSSRGGKMLEILYLARDYVFCPCAHDLPLQDTFSLPSIGNSNTDFPECRAMRCRSCAERLHRVIHTPSAAVMRDAGRCHMHIPLISFLSPRIFKFPPLQLTPKSNLTLLQPPPLCTHREPSPAMHRICYIGAVWASRLAGSFSISCATVGRSSRASRCCCRGRYLLAAENPALLNHHKQE